MNYVIKILQDGSFCVHFQLFFFVATGARIGIVRMKISILGDSQSNHLLLIPLKMSVCLHLSTVTVFFKMRINIVLYSYHILVIL